MNKCFSSRYSCIVLQLQTVFSILLKLNLKYKQKNKKNLLAVVCVCVCVCVCVSFLKGLLALIKTTMYYYTKDPAQIPKSTGT